MSTRYSQTRRSKKAPNMNTSTQQNHFELKKILPLTTNQEKVFDDYDDGKHIIMHGYAGTGKTFIALGLALKDLLTNKHEYERIVILRSVVAARDVGFLPGSLKEKTKIFELPYVEICDELFSDGSGYEILKTKKLVEFATTSYLRGLTFNNSIVIVDEIQNMGAQELSSVITRIGDNSKLIMCGDFRQTDLKTDFEKSGLHDFLEIAKTMDEFSFTEFDVDDIVRSGLVKSYIIAEMEYRNKKDGAISRTTT